MASAPLLAARGLERRFPIGEGVVEALRGVDLEVEAGETHLVTGPSGSGKSTLIYLLGALDRPDAGQVFLAGRELTALGEGPLAAVRREQIGFVFQSHNLLPTLTALENALLPAVPAGGGAAQRERARALLEAVGLGERLAHTPRQLSGGEQQRVAIVRALLMKPQLVLADEPTGELDSQSGQLVVRLLRELADVDGAGLVIVTHDRSLLMPGDLHHQMCDGRIVESRAVGPARD